MDAELQVAFDMLREHVDGRFDRVDQRFEQVDRRFEQVDRRLEGLERHAVTADQRLDRLEVASIDLRRHVDATTAETRRQFHVVEEGLRGDMQLIVEGVTLRMDRLETTLREEIVRSHDSLTALIRLAYTDLDRRVTVLERRPREAG
jgi:hypothetical protein